jgi:hypothetical protein
MPTTENPTPKEIAEEHTQTYQIKEPGNPWKTLSFILGLILACGSLFNVLGKAFYVTRSEYTDLTQQYAVNQAYFKQTLESVERSLNDQRAAFKALSESVADLKLEAARDRSTRNR